jgi:transposase InsO family protein
MVSGCNRPENLWFTFYFVTCLLAAIFVVDALICGGHVYMLVAVDKFTKWVEAAPLTTQDSTAAINFIKSIIFHFGVPYSIITDNGTNFTSKEFKNYCESMGIKLKFASVAHPKTNGQVKKANGLICNGIKKCFLLT